MYYYCPKNRPENPHSVALKKQPNCPLSVR